MPRPQRVRASSLHQRNSVHFVFYIWLLSRTVDDQKRVQVASGPSGVVPPRENDFKAAQPSDRLPQESSIYRATPNDDELGRLIAGFERLFSTKSVLEVRNGEDTYRSKFILNTTNHSYVSVSLVYGLVVISSLDTPPRALRKTSLVVTHTTTFPTSTSQWAYDRCK